MIQVLKMFGCIVVLLAAVSTSAQQYPAKPVHVIVPFTPGGGVDLVGRALAQKLGEAWGQSVIVDNKPGSGGTIGATFVAKAPPDGYTLLIASNPFLVAPSLMANPPYDPLKDFAPITVAAGAPEVLIASLSLPANTVPELIALAKAKPGTLNYGTGGNGDTGHLTAELLKSVAHIDIAHIPYKGNPEVLNDIIGGRVQLMFSAPAAILQSLRAGRIKALAVATPTRYSGLSDVPSFTELGYPAVQASSWDGVLTTAGTPRAVIDKIYADIVKVVQLPDVKARLSNSGYDPTFSASPEEFGNTLRAEFLRWQRVIKESGMHGD
jgi:tripartite-type tricarboxylate transporter receptor subunit TctC